MPQLKKIIAIFLFLTLSVQLIPVQEVGRLLWGQTMTEEITHEINIKHSPALKDAFSHLGITLLSDASLCQNYVIENEALIKCHHLEVLIQPPNSFLLS